MGSSGSAEYPNNEHIEELRSLDKMSPYDRLAYIHKLAEFYKVMDEFDRETVVGLLDKLLLVTRGYKG